MSQQVECFKTKYDDNIKNMLDIIHVHIRIF